MSDTDPQKVASLLEKYQAEYENACDDMFYGYGYKFWRTHFNEIENDEDARIVWHEAFKKMSTDFE